MENKRANPDSTEVSPSKKPKLSKSKETHSDELPQKKNKPKQNIEKVSKYSKENRTEGPTNLKKAKPKTFSQNGKGKFGKPGKQNRIEEKPEDWNEFKKQKKELKLKRKQIRAKDGFDIIVKAKKIGEDLRRKSLKGGEEKRLQLTNELHTMLRGKGHYAKFVLAHDTARLVQWLLKYGSEIIIKQIAKVSLSYTISLSTFCWKLGFLITRNQTLKVIVTILTNNMMHFTSTVFISSSHETILIVKFILVNIVKFALLCGSFPFAMNFHQVPVHPFNI